jgi:hypothetical protein
MQPSGPMAGFGPLSCSLAAFIAGQVAGPLPVRGSRRIVVLGLTASPLPGPLAPAEGADGAVDGMGLCAALLRDGLQLVVLDSPRSRLLIERLLARVTGAAGLGVGACELAAALSDACQGAHGLLLLPGWRADRPLPWGTLCQRLHPSAQVFDLRQDGCLARPAARGLQTWRLGSSQLLGWLPDLVAPFPQGSSSSSRSLS